MWRSIWWSVVLAACGGGSSVDTSVSGQRGPGLLVTPMGVAEQGEHFGFQVSGADPGDRLGLVVGSGGVATGQGPCPPVLNGLCLDVLPGSSGVRLLAQQVADALGQARLNVELPLAMPPGTYGFQVVRQGISGVTGVPAVEVDVAGLEACAADVFEPNDGVGSAAPVGGRIQARLCADDLVDVWQIEVGAGTILQVVLEISVGQGDLDAELLSSSGLLLDGSYTLGTVESLAWYNLTGVSQTVYVRTYANASVGFAGIHYELMPTWWGPEVCLPDAAEPDDDATHARVVGDGVHSGQACQADSDWFSIDMLLGEQVQLDVVDDLVDDVKMKVWNDASVALVYGAVDSFVVDSDRDQTVYVEVVLGIDDEVGGGGAYDLVVSR